MEVPSLPFLVADADAVGDGQSGGVWFVSDVQQLELVEQRSPGRNIWLPEREQRHVRQQDRRHSETDFLERFPVAPSLAGEVHVRAADRVCVLFFVFFKGLERRVIDLERTFSGLDRSSPVTGDWKSTCSALLESVEIHGEVTLK